MKNYLFLFIATFLLLFTSCETEALEPEIQQAQLEAELQARHHTTAVQSFRAHLIGDEEVPAVMTHATGQTIFKLSKDGTELYYKLIVANIEDVRAAHIHVGEFGENGGVAAFLYGGGLIEGKTNGILAEGMITTDDIIGVLAGGTLEDLLELMRAGSTYVNVHTTLYPGGEIRGQIAANNY
ncbi:CHRD domain-containing protein [Salinimicrobium xinjiangense]|uniref:CHRD domain-containing protein n=1 Tax=Salinimicrobium xinjiangense TaxID=438596 RepID=UPI00041823A4|nr:CHRD domain-containing protein [Salinimicrobium xinjiangense]